MPNPEELPFVLKLLDDESETVRSAVASELASYGDLLEQELSKLPEYPDEHQQAIIRSLLSDRNRLWLKEQWLSWRKVENDHKRLEAAMSLIADYQNGRTYPVHLTSLLDSLAVEYLKIVKDPGVLSLAHFLFREKGLEGARMNYYHPLNSNLVHVIEKGKGIPASLTCIYILTGYRLGLRIEGCNYPGHFLARAEENGKTYFVDCFNRGRLLDMEDLVESAHQVSMTKQRLQSRAPAEEIILRVLRNLATAYQQVEDEENRTLMTELAQMHQNPA